MEQTSVESESDRYNRAAVEIGNRLAELRRGSGERPGRRARSVEQLFPAHNRAGLAVALEYERMGNAPVTAELQQRAAALGMAFEHLGVTLGTVIHHVDLKDTLTPAQVQLIRDTLLARKVIFFRDQHLSEDGQVAFSRRFGELDAFPFGQPGDNPYILEINHGKDSPGTENGWHTDVTWMERPSLGSIAQSVEVPPIGGDTLFSDSYAAYLGLPPELAERVKHLNGINDYRVFLSGRGGQPLPEELVEHVKAAIPFGVSHPLLRTHPETGKTSLYIHGGFLRHDSLHDRRTGEPLDPAESQRIVAQLLVQHQRQEYICRFRWAPGSIAFWDNRAVQHYAASDYYPHSRKLRRVTVSGDRPFFDSARHPG